MCELYLCWLLCVYHSQNCHIADTNRSLCVFFSCLFMQDICLSNNYISFIRHISLLLFVSTLKMTIIIMTVNHSKYFNYAFLCRCCCCLFFFYLGISEKANIIQLWHRKEAIALRGAILRWLHIFIPYTININIIRIAFSTNNHRLSLTMTHKHTHTSRVHLCGLRIHVYSVLAHIARNASIYR